MRAVQREVFPGGDRRFFAAEGPPAPAAPEAPPGTPATPPLVDLLARIEALESDTRRLTGRVEELQFRLGQLEAALERSRGDVEFRLNALEGRAAPSPPAPAGSSPAPAEKGSTRPPAAPPETPEDAYRAAYALYRAGDWERAAADLEAFSARFPQSPRASNARYWAGRARMEQGRHAEAAKLFLSSYKTWPKGAMAPSSLLWLGKALVAMKQPKAACDALDQLRTAYPDRLTGSLLAEAQATRAQARCPA